MTANPQPNRVCQSCQWATWDQGTRCRNPDIGALEPHLTREYSPIVTEAYGQCQGKFWTAPTFEPRNQKPQTNESPES